ncbi:MAG: hypothetical protein Q7J07_00610 [Pelolinea sp.]|nr:hypothetical protein [Pelolinea sp.]
MEKLKIFFKNPVSLGLVGLVVGMILGLVVLGWGIWPVKWTDAAPATLQEDYQRDYLCMTIDSYIKNQDMELMQLRWDGLGEDAEKLLNTLTPAVCRFSSTAEIDAFKEVMSIQSLVSEFSTDAPVLEAPAEELNGNVLEIGGEEIPEAKTISILPLAILILLTLVVGGILVFLMIKRSKGDNAGQAKAAKVVIPKNDNANDPFHQSEKNATKEAPLAQFMTTYRQGDDLYDDSFSIDSLNGEFLGECGVGIAETIGVGDPKKVTALEVWLFDKNDIQTVTKVLMSEHANNDSTLRQRLLSKGEPILIEPGMRFLMETASLQLEAHVIDMVYARGPLPENSYFSRLTLEVSVWAK